MKTYEDMKLETLSEEELITELSLGKVSSTVVVSRVMMLTRKLQDKNLGEVLKWLSILIYTVSLQQKSKKKETNQIDKKSIRSKIKWRHLQ